MRKYILMPDSFKGTMESIEVCNFMENSIRQFDGDAEIVKIPVADGGEGSVDCFLTALNGEKVIAKAHDPYMKEIDSFFGLIDGGKTAVIEMAASSGLPLAEGNLSAKKTTTYGVGDLIKSALDKNVSKIIMGLGGSATNDCGVGMIVSLGGVFKNASGEAFLPTGGTLSEVVDIDVSNLDKRLKDVEIVTMCDIDNPLWGEFGASNIFGRQKGATEEDVVLLDNNLKNFSTLVKQKLFDHNEQFEGAGAAGGLGYAMKTFLNSKIQMGIETVLDTVKFDEIAKDAFMIFTGEGRMDGQSLRGKVVIGISRRAQKMNVPVIAVVGDIGDGAEGAYDQGVSAVFSINRVAKPFSELKLRAKEDMQRTMNDILRLIGKVV